MLLSQPSTPGVTRPPVVQVQCAAAPLSNQQQQCAEWREQWTSAWQLHVSCVCLVSPTAAWSRVLSCLTHLFPFVPRASSTKTYAELVADGWCCTCQNPVCIKVLLLRKLWVTVPSSIFIYRGRLQWNTTAQALVRMLSVYIGSSIYSSTISCMCH